jgi:membrane protease YdiL (CAAX protease family)
MLKILFYFVIAFAIPVAASLLPLDQLLQKCIAVMLLFLFTYFLYKKEGKTVSALGINGRWENLRYIPLGLLSGILFFCLLFFFQKLYNGLSISVNPNANYGFIITGLALALPGVLMEELIFRGYCLQKTVLKIGAVRANILFAFLFIVWHWLAFNAWGNWGLMLSMITTGFGHVFFAVAFSRSQTLLFPIALHLGNNWASRNLFSLNMGQIVNPKQTSDSLFLISAPAAQFSTPHVVIGYAITIGCFCISIAIIMLLFKQKSSLETV